MSSEIGFTPKEKKSFLPRKKNVSRAQGGQKKLFTPTMINNMVVLILLYMTQGCAFGLVTGSLPVLLNAKGISHSEISIISLASTPYCLKILWAPFVDCWYISTVGRRRSYVIPCTLFVAAIVYLLSVQINMLLETVRVKLLAFYLFCVILVLSWQDVAVDAWALHLLSSPRQKPFASTCQSVGLGLGFFFGFPLLLALSDVEFSNRLRSEPQDAGLLDLCLFFQIWSIALLFMGICVASKFREDEYIPSTQDVKSVFNSVFALAKRPHFRSLALLLCVVTFPFGIIDTITPLHFLDLGVSKEQVVLLGALQSFLQHFVSFFIARSVSKGTSELELVARGNIWICFISFFFPLASFAFTKFGTTYLTTILIGFIMLFLVGFSRRFIITSLGAYFNKISDVSIGGTYQTLLNSLFNIGAYWPKFLAYQFSGMFGYYNSTAIFLVCSFLLYHITSKACTSLQTVPDSLWKLDKSGKNGKT